MLDELLEYQHTPQPDTFVADVMKAVERQQQIRKLILTGSGLVGGIFGIAGAMMLSDPIARLVSQFATGESALPMGLAAMSVVAFLAWLLQDRPV